jgi:hypothetical protein
MLEDVRNHDAAPTAEEREWIDSNPIAAAVRVAVFLAFAVSIGGYLSFYFEPAPTAHTIAKADK